MKSAMKPVTSSEPRLTPDQMLNAAKTADRASPSVRPPGPSEKVVGMNFKVLLSTSDEVAAVAKKRGVSMKIVVMQALEAAGVKIAGLDLEDRTPSRRKGK